MGAGWHVGRGRQKRNFSSNKFRIFLEANRITSTVGRYVKSINSQVAKDIQTTISSVFSDALRWIAPKQTK